MAGRYGMTFAAKLIQQGKYAEAVEEASRAVARDEEDPAALVDRASAYAWLERYPEAVRDLEAALALDQVAGVLESDVVDDAYFSALLGAAKLGRAVCRAHPTPTPTRSSRATRPGHARPAASSPGPCNRRHTCTA